ncbi:MAG: hypothetical protein R3B13_29965 [Polyangiaceae bacterium]
MFRCNGAQVAFVLAFLGTFGCSSDDNATPSGGSAGISAGGTAGGSAGHAGMNAAGNGGLAGSGAAAGGGTDAGAGSPGSGGAVASGGGWSGGTGGSGALASGGSSSGGTGGSGGAASGGNAGSSGSSGNGNVNPNFVPKASDYLYVDLNRATNGSGASPQDPSNVLPTHLPSGRQLFFNGDGGIQRISCRDNSLWVDGDNVQIGSFGSKRAVISAYQVFSGGWTQVGTSTVYKRSFAGGTSGAGPVVGNVIDLSSHVDSPEGDVLQWQNLEEEGNKIGVFRANPAVLPKGAYAYDWQQQVMYVNVGKNANTSQLGIACVGRFINTANNLAPGFVAVHDLRLIGFSRVAINLAGGAHYWRIHDLQLYASGGMYNTTSQWYFGSGVQMTQQVNNVEIDHNEFVETFDSPITPQHFGGSSGGNLHDIFVHDNLVDRWALGGVEISDFGTSNKFSAIRVWNNTMKHGGSGFSGIGDTPTGITDGVQVRGGAAGGSISGLSIIGNRIHAFDANVALSGNHFQDAVVLENNDLCGATTAVKNAAKATLQSKNNSIHPAPCSFE